MGRGRRITTTVNEINLKLRGWKSYFRLPEVKGVLEELDGWIRRKLRGLHWRQRQRSAARGRLRPMGAVPGGMRARAT